MRRLLIPLLLVSLSGAAVAAPAGQMFQLAGAVGVVRDGRLLPAQAGGPLKVGDVLHLDASEAAALRMDDEELISLAESTRFAIVEHRFDPAASSGNRARYRLESGSARLISGRIARQQPGSVILDSDYGQVSTVGTDYTAGICAACTPAGLYVSVHSGSVKVTTATGSIVASAGQVVFVAAGAAPTMVSAAPPGLLLPPDPAAMMLSGVAEIGPVRIEVTGSVCDPAASPSQPDCSSGR